MIIVKVSNKLIMRMPLICHNLKLRNSKLINKVLLNINLNKIYLKKEIRKMINKSNKKLIKLKIIFLFILLVRINLKIKGMWLEIKLLNWNYKMCLLNVRIMGIRYLYLNLTASSGKSEYTMENYLINFVA